MPIKFTQHEFVTRAKAIHGSKYDYSQAIYKNSGTPVKIYCKQCERYFFQKPLYHTFSKCDCPYHAQFGAKTTPIDKWISLCKKKHGDKYDYRKVVFTNLWQEVKIRCGKHNKWFTQIAQYHKKGFSGCAKCTSELKSKNLAGHRMYYPTPKTIRVKGKSFYINSSHEAKFIKLFYPKFLGDFEGQQKVPLIRYKDGSKERFHKPDFFIPSQNRLVEVKCLYTLGTYNGTRSHAFLNAKKKALAALKQGFKYNVVMHKKGNFIVLPDRWVNMTRKEVRKYYG